MAFDRGAGVVVMFGGDDAQGYATGTYQWDGSLWSLRSTTGPIGRDAGGMAYDSRRGTVVLHGGFDATYSTQTWELTSAGPPIVQQPASVTAASGQPATFTVVAPGASSFQWRRNSAPLSNGGNISGATTATLTINPVGAGDAGSYDVQVANACGTGTSDPATLTVGGSCYPNCDSSTSPPVLNVADFTCFLQKFAAANPYANCDNSTAAPVLNVADFTCFLQKYAAGCP
jgi:hypothetical protein